MPVAVVMMHGRAIVVTVVSAMSPVGLGGADAAEGEQGGKEKGGAFGHDVGDP